MLLQRRERGIRDVAVTALPVDGVLWVVLHVVVRHREGHGVVPLGVDKGVDAFDDQHALEVNPVPPRPVKQRRHAKSGCQYH